MRPGALLQRDPNPLNLGIVQFRRTVTEATGEGEVISFGVECSRNEQGKLMQPLVVPTA